MFVMSYSVFLKRFVCLVEVHYHCSNPSAAVLCHNSPEEVTWLVMKI